MLEEGGQVSIEALASACSARADRLEQVLRVFISNSIFGYDKTTKMYTNKNTSKLFLSNHWNQQHRWATLYRNEFYNIARGIPSSLHNDAVHSAALINYDTDLNIFKYFHSQGLFP